MKQRLKINRAMKKIILKKGKDEAVRRQHTWIFSGAIAHTEGGLSEGDLVEVLDNKRAFLALGYFSTGSISIRILSFEPTVVDENFWYSKLQNAYTYRLKIGLIHSVSTTCYRLVHGEGDGLSGLIIDVYGSVAVIQCHAVGMHRHIESLATALKKIYGDKLTAIYDKSAETLSPQQNAGNAVKTGFQNGYVWGTSETPLQVLENGNAFAIDWVKGQKTGFFLDQRDNRALLSQYVVGKSVLNTFCYSGGFSIYALKAGARYVHSVDISQKAIDLTEHNVQINQAFDGQHEATAADVLPFLKENSAQYDVVILDPPAFAKSLAKRHNAVQAYKRLNALALKHMTDGGILFTFSCSQVVDRQLFYDTIVAAGIEAGRRIRVMHHLTQAADHPVNMFHPEGSYLKGLVLYVE